MISYSATFQMCRFTHLAKIEESATRVLGSPASARYQTGNPSISDFSANLTSDILILADSSHLPSAEAYRQCLSLPCNRLSTPCYECKPNTRHFSTKFSLKRGSAGGKCVYSVT